LQHAFLAGCLARLGATDEAQMHRREALRLRPTLRVDTDCVPTLHYKHAADRYHHRESLLAAGFEA
jgi:hypothetical protein